jgi:hypothetical protein
MNGIPLAASVRDTFASFAQRSTSKKIDASTGRAIIAACSGAKIPWA